MYVLPITHTSPINPEFGKEIPSRIKQRLGLDERWSWDITTDVSKLTWPGYDIRRLDADLLSYGVLLEKLVKKIIKSVHFHAKNNKSNSVIRDD